MPADAAARLKRQLWPDGCPRKSHLLAQLCRGHAGRKETNDGRPLPCIFGLPGSWLPCRSDLARFGARPQRWSENGLRRAARPYACIEPWPRLSAQQYGWHIGDWNGVWITTHHLGAMFMNAVQRGRGHVDRLLPCWVGRQLEAGLCRKFDIDAPQVNSSAPHNRLLLSVPGLTGVQGGRSTCSRTHLWLKNL